MTRTKDHPGRAILPLALAFFVLPSWAADVPPRPASQQEYWAQFDRKDWDAAEKEAERLVETARQTEPLQAIRLADALSLLGNAQLGQGNYVAAEGAFIEALRLVEKYSTPSSQNLITPLRGLGYTLAASSRHVEAIPLLERALLIAHRTQGLFDIGQQGILRQLAASLTHAGRTSDAEKQMSYLLRVGQRTYGADDVRILPVLNVVADWYCSTANFGPSRQLYGTALQLAESKLGPNNLAVVEPLRGIARTYTEELYYASLGLVLQRNPGIGDFGRPDSRPTNPRYLNEDGQEALERALRILDANPDRSAAVLAAALIEMGDWFQTKQEPDKARVFYQRAWAVEGTAPAESGKAHLDFPVRLYYPTPQSAVRTMAIPQAQSEERFVHMEFTVTSEGTVKDARVIEENATARQTSDALQSIRAAWFRPKFVEGVPVETAAVTYREIFRVRKKSDDKEENEQQGELHEQEEQSAPEGPP
jgi:tetratricopeptide (TPR) repeat protein